MVHAVIPAAGDGRRMGKDVKKPYLTLCGLPTIVHTLNTFEKSDAVSDITCVVREEDVAYFLELISNYPIRKIRGVIPGGVRRQDSVEAAIVFLHKTVGEGEIVVVHDAARPLVSLELIRRVIETAIQWGGAIAAIPVHDTLKWVDENETIQRTINRDRLWRAQTPQAFRLGILMAAYRNAREDGFEATDDAGLVEHLGMPVKCVLGHPDNIKITTQADLQLAEQILDKRRMG